LIFCSTSPRALPHSFRRFIYPLVKVRQAQKKLDASFSPSHRTGQHLLTDFASAGVFLFFFLRFGWRASGHVLLTHLLNSG